MTDEHTLPLDVQHELAMLRARVAQAEDEAQRLRDMIDSLGDVAWSHDPATGSVLYVSAAVEQIYGYPRDAFVADPLLWLTVVHPDDRPMAEAFLPHIHTHGSAAIEYRILRPDGSIRWIQDRGTASRDSTGTPIRFDGLATDITARKQVETEREQQREQRERLQRQEQVIDAQRAALRELAAPLIPLTDAMLVMPLIGALDSTRAQTILETLLTGIGDYQAETVILDVTGISLIDTQIANALIRAANAARLLGAQVILTGIKPEVAQTLVGLGINLDAIMTHSTLQRGIEHALRHQGRTGT